jgi:hypothetical protein
MSKFKSKEYPTPQSKVHLLHVVLDHYLSLEAVEQFTEIADLVEEEVRESMQALSLRIGKFELIARRMRG